MIDHTALRHSAVWDGWAGWEIWYYGSEASVSAEAVEPAVQEAPLSMSPAPHLWVVREDASAATLSVANLPWPSDSARQRTSARAA